MRRTRLLALWTTALIVSATGLSQEMKAPAPSKLVRKAATTKIRPETYGTTATSYTRIGASEFTGIQVPGNDNWDDVYSHGAGWIFRRYGQNTNAEFIATAHLPSGALLTYLELDNCGGNPGQTVILDLFNCDYTGNCGSGPASQIVATPGCGDDSADISGQGIVVDNFTNEIVCMVQVNANDGSNNFAGVIIGYQLQVSPAPSTPTFNDVPTSDFGYQYIEALSASGITGGCGGGAYCPDSPVTRRQMAIFIAKALGLQWP